MRYYKISGGRKLSGEVQISSSKNSVVALIPAAILCDEEVVIENYPEIADVNLLIDILRKLNVFVSVDGNKMTINPQNFIYKPLLFDEIKKMRASYYFMGSLLGRCNHITTYFPGGCNLGDRPIDLHVKGFRALSVEVDITNEIIDLKKVALKGNKVYLDFPSVGATINLILASVKANGVTIIENAAKEPEVIDIVNFLNGMGAKINGAGTGVIKITGVNYLHKTKHQVIPDRIEAGTYIIYAVAFGEKVKITNVIPQHLDAVINKVREMGANIEVYGDYIEILESESFLKSVDIQTAIYPGFPTDLQQIFVTLLTQCEGVGKVRERIFNKRFNNCMELEKMGIKFKYLNNEVIVEGPQKLKNAETRATDLRGGAAVVLASLIIDGESKVYDIEHIERGYEKFVDKLRKLGVKIDIIDE